MVANAVTAMQQAQSPRLRRKVDALIGNGLAVESIGQRVWSAIISQVKPPSVPAPRIAVRSDEMRDEMMQRVTDHALLLDSSDLICLGEDLRFPDHEVVLDESDDIAQTKGTPPIIQIDYDALATGFQSGTGNLSSYGFNSLTTESRGNPYRGDTGSLVEFGSQFYVMGETFSI